MRSSGWLALSMALGFVSACGEDEPTEVDAGPQAPESSCVQAGDIGNSQGVGTFCWPGGRVCNGFDLAPLCLAEAAPEDGQWFCTRLCDEDADCGENAVCDGDGRGSACIPARCDPGDDEEEDAGVPEDASADLDAE